MIMVSMPVGDGVETNLIEGYGDFDPAKGMVQYIVGDRESSLWQGACSLAAGPWSYERINA